MKYKIYILLNLFLSSINLIICHNSITSANVANNDSQSSINYTTTYNDIQSTVNPNDDLPSKTNSEDLNSTINSFNDLQPTINPNNPNNLNNNNNNNKILITTDFTKPYIENTLSKSIQKCNDTSDCPLYSTCDREYKECFYGSFLCPHDDTKNCSFINPAIWDPISEKYTEKYKELNDNGEKFLPILKSCEIETRDLLKGICETEICHDDNDCYSGKCDHFTCIAENPIYLCSIKYIKERMNRPELKCGKTRHLRCNDDNDCYFQCFKNYCVNYDAMKYYYDLYYYSIFIFGLIIALLIYRRVILKEIKKYKKKADKKDEEDKETKEDENDKETENISSENQNENKKEDKNKNNNENINRINTIIPTINLI